jgi:hypothetical protein
VRNSFPVYRLGHVFGPEQQISARTAREIAHEIKREGTEYVDVVMSALRAAGARDIVLDDEPDVQEQFDESYILNLRGMVCTLGRYRVASSSSLTVCMKEHRSKVWNRLLCLDQRGQPALGMTIPALKRYFAAVEPVAKRVVRELAARYFTEVRQHGVDIVDDADYAFRLRAYQTADRSAEKLMMALGSDLTLAEALASQEYRRELLNYFSVVFGEQPGPKKILEALKRRTVETYGHTNEDRDAFVTVRLADRRADIWTFGYDPSTRPSSNLLGTAATRELLTTYARQL